MDMKQWLEMSLEFRAGHAQMMDALTSGSDRVGAVIPVRDLPLIWWALRQANRMGLVPGNRANLSRAMEYVWSQLDDDVATHLAIMDDTDLVLQHKYNEVVKDAVPTARDDSDCPF